MSRVRPDARRGGAEGVARMSMLTAYPALFAQDVTVAALAAWGAFVAVAASAVTTLIIKVLPAWANYRHKKHLTDAERRKSEAEVDSGKRIVAMTEHDRITRHWEDIVTRMEEDSRHKDERLRIKLDQINHKDEQIDRLLMEMEKKTRDHADCMVKNEKLLTRLTLMEARLDTLARAEDDQGLPTRADAVVIVDAKGRVQDWSPSAHVLFHWSKEEVLGRKVDFLIPKEYLERHLAGFGEVVRTGRAVRRGPYHLTALTREGEPVRVDVLLAQWEGEGGPLFSASMRQALDLPRGPSGALAASAEAASRAASAVLLESQKAKLPEQPAAEHTVVVQTTTTTTKAEPDKGE